MNIYVGNLPFNVTEQELRSLFEQFGEVSSASIISDKFSGQSRGFGFVEMPQKENAQQAIQKLAGADFKGRAITVNEAKPRTERSGDRGDRRDRGDRPRRKSW